MTQTIRLGDVCSKVGSGATPRGGKNVYVSEGPFALIRSQNVLNEGFSAAGLAFISPAQARLLDGVAVEKNDILLNITGDSVARVCQVNTDVLPARVNQHVAIIRPTSTRLDPRYLRYYLVSPSMQELMLGLAASGATRNALTKGMIEDFRIDCPPLPEQQAIAGVLGALDDKIELNRRMNRTLEAMARALFRSWFVDFDPVRARAEGRAPAHMDPATAALFPARFGEDGLPEGWVSKPIGEAADIAGGSTPSTKNPAFWDGEFLWATPRDLSKLQSPILLDTERKITGAGVQQISSRQLPAGTLLLSSRAPIGYLAIARRPVSVNQGFIAIRESEEVSGVHALFWCHENMEAIVSNANGSTFQEISKRNFRPLPIVVASPEVRNSFAEQAGRWVDLIAANEEQSRTLAALRDALLPKLMSGELRIRDAERALAEAV